MITIRRIYDPEEPGEDYKVLVDRFWPRGISKEKAGWDEWIKEIAPSNGLRKWFGHDSLKWEEFKNRYLAELQFKQQEILRIKNLIQNHNRVVLLYGSRNREFNHAAIIRDYLDQKNV